MTISQRPYGSWSTPISSELLVSAAVQLSGLHADGQDALWAEGRPAEGGRTQLVRRAPDGTTTDLLPAGFNARTGVHEYGGAAWWTREGVTWFTNWTDQRLNRLSTGGTPEPLTAEPTVPRGDRFADGTVSPDGTTIACVRERHTASGAAADVRNEIVRLAAHVPSEPEVLVTGPDFVAAPRWSPDGGTLAYLRWNHPSMPWDSTELVVLDLASGTETVVAGGEGESIAEPRWGSDGALWFISDRGGWWNLYRVTGGSDIEPMVLMEAEIGVPGWVLGSTRYALLPDGRAVFARQSNGYDALVVRGADGTLTELDLPYSCYSTVAPDSGGDSVLVVAGSPTSELEAARVSLGTEPVVTSLRPPRDFAAHGGLDRSYLSVPEHVSFPSTWPDGSPRTAHALFYPPTNPEHRAPDGELPPLLVVIHGGPTSAAVPVLQLELQYWTSRGFAVVDVNYGGSTGYGRGYRDQLLGNWGLIDVADCVASARWLAEDNRVDPARLCIRGGSAGGYTTLAALVLDDTPFAAGADHYGVSDLEALAADTHKFESRYLDRLIGPFPEARDVYVERSPLTHVDKFHTPLIVLQGSEDRVVPPNQSSMIVDALRANGVPVAYLLFDGEEHGFRRAENIRRATDGELSFYAQIFGFTVEGINPVQVSGKAAYSRSEDSPGR